MDLPPSQLDISLHALSLQIAAVYHIAAAPDAPATAESEDNILDDIIIAYRSIRRHINKGANGKRFGHDAAHRMMQGDI